MYDRYMLLPIINFNMKITTSDLMMWIYISSDQIRQPKDLRLNPWQVKYYPLHISRGLVQWCETILKSITPMGL
jgi:hypothetical protein